MSVNIAKMFNPEQHREHLLLLMHLFNPHNEPTKDKPDWILTQRQTSGGMPLISMRWQVISKMDLPNFISKLESHKNEFDEILTAVSYNDMQTYLSTVSLPSNTDDLIRKCKLIEGDDDEDTRNEKLAELLGIILKISYLYIQPLSKENIQQDQNTVQVTPAANDSKKQLAYFFYGPGLIYSIGQQILKISVQTEVFMPQLFEHFMDIVDGNIEMLSQDISVIIQWQKPPIVLEQRCKLIQQYARQQINLQEWKSKSDDKTLIIDYINAIASSHGIDKCVFLCTAAMEIFSKDHDQRQVGAIAETTTQAIRFITRSQEYEKCAYILQDIATAKNILPEFKVKLLGAILTNIQVDSDDFYDKFDTYKKIISKRILEIIKSLPSGLDRKTRNGLQSIANDCPPLLWQNLQQGNDILQQINKMITTPGKPAKSKGSSPSSLPQAAPSPQKTSTVADSAHTQQKQEKQLIDDTTVIIQEIEAILKKYEEFDKQSKELFRKITGQYGLTTEQQQTTIINVGGSKPITIESFIDDLRDSQQDIKDLKIYQAQLTALVQNKPIDITALKEKLRQHSTHTNGQIHLSYEPDCIEGAKQTFDTYAAEVERVVNKLLEPQAEPPARPVGETGQTYSTPLPDIPAAGMPSKPLSIEDVLREATTTTNYDGLLDTVQQLANGRQEGDVEFYRLVMGGIQSRDDISRTIQITNRRTSAPENKTLSLPAGSSIFDLALMYEKYEVATSIIERLTPEQCFELLDKSCQYNPEIMTVSECLLNETLFYAIVKKFTGIARDTLVVMAHNDTEKADKERYLQQIQQHKGFKYLHRLMTPYKQQINVRTKGGTIISLGDCLATAEGSPLEHIYSLNETQYAGCPSNHTTTYDVYKIYGQLLIPTAKTEDEIKQIIINLASAIDTSCKKEEMRSYLYSVVWKAEELGFNPITMLASIGIYHKNNPQEKIIPRLKGTTKRDTYCYNIEILKVLKVLADNYTGLFSTNPYDSIGQERKQYANLLLSNPQRLAKLQQDIADTLDFLKGVKDATFNRSSDIVLAYEALQKLQATVEKRKGEAAGHHDGHVPAVPPQSRDRQGQAGAPKPPAGSRGRPEAEAPNSIHLEYVGPEEPADGGGVDLSISDASSSSGPSSEHPAGTGDSAPPPAPNARLEAIEKQARRKIEEANNRLSEYGDFESRAGILIDEIEGREARGYLPPIDGLTEAEKDIVVVNTKRGPITIRGFCNLLISSRSQLECLRNEISTLQSLLQTERIAKRFLLQSQMEAIDTHLTLLSLVQSKSQIFYKLEAAVRDKIEKIRKARQQGKLFLSRGGGLSTIQEGEEIGLVEPRDGAQGRDAFPLPEASDNDAYEAGSLYGSHPVQGLSPSSSKRHKGQRLSGHPKPKAPSTPGRPPKAGDTSGGAPESRVAAKPRVAPPEGPAGQQGVAPSIPPSPTSAHPLADHPSSSTDAEQTQPLSTEAGDTLALGTSGVGNSAPVIPLTYRTAVQQLTESFQKSLPTAPIKEHESRIVLARKGNEDFVQPPTNEEASKVEVAPLSTTSMTPTTKAVKDNTLVAVVPSANDSEKHLLQFTNVEAELRQTKQLLVADGDAVAMGYAVQQAAKSAETTPTPAQSGVEKAVGTKVEEIAKQANEGKIDKTELAKVLGKCVQVANEKLQQLMALVVRMHAINLLTARSVKETAKDRVATNREIVENLKLFNTYLAQMAETFKITDAKATGESKVYNGKKLMEEIKRLEQEKQQEMAKEKRDEERLKELDTQLKAQRADFAKLTELLNVSVVNVMTNPAVVVQLKKITLENLKDAEHLLPERPLSATARRPLDLATEPEKGPRAVSVGFR